MARCNLRIYHGPEEAGAAALGQTSCPRRLISVAVAEILPLLAEAYQSQRTWLRDFGDDEMTISSDLYEVLMAYQHCRRPSA